jgi:hypothetical protein
MNYKLGIKILRRSMLMVVVSLICFISYGQNEPDTSKAWMLYRPQQQVNQDSIEARLKFVQDSIREQFVKDSILRRERIMDSLAMLQRELQPLLETIHFIVKEDIVSYSEKIAVIGDSVLGDYVYHKLPLTLADPYCPWKERLSLAAKNFRFKVDESKQKISMLELPFLKCSFQYASSGLLIVNEDYILQNNTYGSFFKIPVDSVFYDNNKRVVKIKRYIHFYKLVNNYRKGEFLFTNLMQVKQYQYDANNRISQYELVRFCERYSAYQPNKVCGIIKYSVSKQGNNYLLTRHNNPENEFTDGTFTLEYDGNGNIKSMTFKNLKNTRTWQRFVEVNKEGNVNCYIDKSQGITESTTCMIYHNEPNAKYPVEIINTTYEKDGVSYWQKNTTTGKTRVRDRLTMEWGPWM